MFIGSVTQFPFPLLKNGDHRGIFLVQEQSPPPTRCLPSIGIATAQDPPRLAFPFPLSLAAFRQFQSQELENADVFV